MDADSPEMPPRQPDVVRVEVGRKSNDLELGSQGKDLIYTPVQQDAAPIFSLPNFPAMTIGFCTFRLLRPLLLVSLYPGAPALTDPVALFTLSCAVAAACAGVIAALLVCKKPRWCSRCYRPLTSCSIHQRCRFRVSCSEVCHRIALWLLLGAALLDVLHQVAAVACWKHFFGIQMLESDEGGSGDGADDKNQGEDAEGAFVGYLLVLLHTAGLIGIVLLCCTFARPFAAAWRQQKTGRVAADKSNSQKNNELDGKASLRGASRSENGDKSLPEAPVTPGRKMSDPGPNIQSVPSPARAGAARHSSASDNGQQKVWAWSNGMWEKGRLVSAAGGVALVRFSDGAYHGRAFTIQRSLVRPRRHGEDKPACPGSESKSRPPSKDNIPQNDKHEKKVDDFNRCWSGKDFNDNIREGNAKPNEFREPSSNNEHQGPFRVDPQKGDSKRQDPQKQESERDESKPNGGRKESAKRGSGDPPPVPPPHPSEGVPKATPRGEGAPKPTSKGQGQSTPRTESRGAPGTAQSTPRGCGGGASQSTPRGSGEPDGGGRARSASVPSPAVSTPREKTEDEKWVDNEIQKLRDELMGIADVAKRKARLRELQREWHPDKNPTEMSARVTPLFHYVQRWWEDPEGYFEQRRAADRAASK